LSKYDLGKGCRDVSDYIINFTSIDSTILYKLYILSRRQTAQPNTEKNNNYTKADKE